MIYCRLLKNENNKLIYSIGSVISDITGKMELSPQNQSYQIIEQPKEEPVYEHFIDKMLRLYQKDFDKGVIPEKMSYEI